MYKNFFGFKERPFKLVPNPAYLFLSKSHEEALAHLTYAMTQGDGFVEITGEIGTGKTTLCRAFLENLDENTAAAYIFNPKLDSIQLLKAVNDEFEISSGSDNTKDLIDTLNTFLIERKAEGKNVILLIDEAQNLTEDVLEQLRLLSNLETTRHKLLQIILVGQPELGEKLDSHELRQLAQRINLRCQLLPLNYKEVRNYIQHRINIASRKPGIKFSRAAYRCIYQYSLGIPRLINIVCDRALLSAFGADQHKITGRIANSAIRELAGRGDIKYRSFYERKKTLLYFSLLSLSLFLLFLHSSGRLDVNSIFRSTESKTPDISEPEHPNSPGTKNLVSNPKPAALKTTKEPEEYVAPAWDFTSYLMEMDTRSSRHMALRTVMGLWHIESEIKPSLHDIDDDHTFLRLAAKQNGFLLRRVEGDLSLVNRLNLPAVLALHPSEDLSPVYLTVTQTDDNKITLRNGLGNSVMAVEPGDLESCWSGVAYIPWKNFFSLTGTIPLDAPGDTIITLKMLLRDIGYNAIEISPVYDEDAQQAIKNIQKKHGIGVDGIVGSSTKIVLYNEKKSLEIPHITSQ